ncbi:MAG: hypothetical protein IT380_03945 [Myxococcales bacterium]|nr:hypothetical protein [Myxococcales bacterium]
MLTAALLVALTQAPQSVTLLEGGWVAADVDENQITLWNDVLFSELSEFGISVRRKGDIAQALGLERQKQLMGCAESNCSAEIAQALNADGIISGSIGKSGSSLVLNIRVLSNTGDQLAAKSAVVPSADAALAEMKPIARALAEAMAPHLAGRVTVKAKAAPGLKRFWWIPASIGVITASVGIGLQVSAHGIESSVREGSSFNSLTEVQVAMSSGKTQETVSYVMFGLAGAAAVSTVLLVVLGQDSVEAAPVTLAPTLNGFVLTGRWP